MRELLKSLRACEESLEWAGEKSWPEIFETCHRGDWLLWLFRRTNPDDIKRLTLAKAHCANTVRHLMKLMTVQEYAKHIGKSIPLVGPLGR